MPDVTDQLKCTLTTREDILLLRDFRQLARGRMRKLIMGWVRVWVDQHRDRIE